MLDLISVKLRSIIDFKSDSVGWSTVVAPEEELRTVVPSIEVRSAPEELDRTVGVITAPEELERTVGPEELESTLELITAPEELESTVGLITAPESLESTEDPEDIILSIIYGF
jgi:hypothetical protein